jgi:ABC-type polysaccharide/polyol phosphate transport system ATPase subunit
MSGSDSTLPAVEFTGVGKHYRIRLQKSYLLNDAVRTLFRRRQRIEVFHALREVSFTVPRGQAVSFIGGNGAGKSTILGLVVGTVFPSAGTVRVRGRIGALLELGAGFHPDLTGRENIYLNASLLGMQREEVDERVGRIVEFSELKDFMDAPLRTYSSGMQVRLGFSVAVHLDPEILIMDEVLAVGDQHFQHKCIRRVREFREMGRTLLFVSHSPESVRQICDRAIWLDQGRVRADGSLDEVLPRYEKVMA